MHFAVRFVIFFPINHVFLNVKRTPFNLYKLSFQTKITNVSTEKCVLSKLACIISILKCYFLIVLLNVIFIALSTCSVKNFVYFNGFLYCIFSNSFNKFYTNLLRVSKIVKINCFLPLEARLKHFTKIMSTSLKPMKSSCLI